jgi:hypothetical protein
LAAERVLRVKYRKLVAQHYSRVVKGDFIGWLWKKTYGDEVRECICLHMPIAPLAIPVQAPSPTIVIKNKLFLHSQPKPVALLTIVVDPNAAGLIPTAIPRASKRPNNVLRDRDVNVPTTSRGSMTVDKRHGRIAAVRTEHENSAIANSR